MTGNGKGRQTHIVNDVSVTVRTTLSIEGSADESGNLTLMLQVQQCATSGEERQCGEGAFPRAWTIDPDGTLRGTITWEDGQEWSIEGSAVSGGPGG